MSQDPAQWAQQLEAKQRELRRHLPQQMQALITYWNQIQEGALGRTQIEGLYQLIHSLLGTAGTLGVQWSSDTLQTLEGRLSGWLTSEPGQEQGLEFLWPLMNAFLALEAEYLGEGLESSIQCLVTPIPLSAPSAKGTLLIFEDNPEEGSHLHAILELHGFATEIHDDPEAFLKAARLDPEAILLVDVVTPENRDQGLELIETLRREGGCPPRVVFMSGRTDFGARLAAVRAGGLYFFHKPLRFMELLLVMDEIVVRGQARPYRLLMVEDDQPFAEVISLHLKTSGVEVRVVAEPSHLLDTLGDFDPELVLMDLGLPGCSGAELAAILRQHAAYRDLPLVFLSAESDPTEQRSAMAHGGEDFLLKPISPEHLVQQLLPRLAKRRDIVISHIALKQERMELAQLRAGLDAHAIVSVTDRAGRILFANEKFCEISGYSRSELLGKTHRLVKSAQHPPAFFEDMWRTIQGGSIWHGEIQNRNKQGGHYWVETTIVPILGADRHPDRYVAIRTEVTALHQAMEAAKVSEERLLRSQTHANIGTWDWDLQTGRGFWSEGIPALFGYSEKDLEPNFDTFMQTVHPEDRPRVLEASNVCVLQGVPIDLEHRIVWPDGTVKWLHESGNVVRAQDGTPLHLLGVVQDITQRKEVEEALQKREALYRRLSEDMPLFIATFVPDGTLTYANNTLSASIGMSPAQLVGLNFYDFLSQEDREMVRSRLAALTPENPLESHEQRYQRPGERDVYHQWTNRAFFNEAGNPTHYQAVGQDISTAKIAEEALREAHQFNEQVIRSAKEGIIVYGPDLNYQAWNPFMEHLSGLASTEVLGKSPEELFPFLREAGVIERLERSLAGFPVESVDFPYQIPSTGKSGWVTDTSGPF